MPSARIALTAYLRAFAVFASTPRAGKKLPPRLSKGKRKKFSLTVFTSQSWKRFTGKKHATFAYLPAESFMSYINRIDDLLDQLNHPSVVTNRLTYKKDPVARQHVSDFVRGVRISELSNEQKREMYRLAGNFRRTAWNELASFEKKPNPGFDDIIRMKERTTGGMGRLLVSMFNTAEKVPISQRERIEKAFSDAFMATQVPDDIYDVREDYLNRVPNLAIAALRPNPAEFEWAIRQSKMTISQFQRNCPEAYHKLRTLFHEYLSRLPTQNTGERAFQAIPALFWKIARLTKR